MVDIHLREVKEQDWVKVHAYASIKEVSRFQPWGPNTEEESKAYVNEIITDAEKIPRDRFAYTILEDEKVIGIAELTIRDRINECGEISYILHPDQWGKGIATRVASMLLSFGFIEHCLHKIQGTCHPDNQASKKVLERIGMTKEGVIRDDLKVKDGWRDSLVYGILDWEWKA